MQVLENIFNKNTVNIMVDLETLGTTPGCKVLSIGLAYFTENGVKKLDEFYPLLTEQKGFVNESTVEWWRAQSSEAKGVFSCNLLSGISIEECAYRIEKFIDDAKLLNGVELGAKCQVNMWGNGSSFDLSILQQLFIGHNVKVPWNTFGDRCYRTAMKILGPALQIARDGTHHRAEDDAKYQALCLIGAIKNASEPK